MADKSIGDLPAAAAIYDDDLFLLEQSGEAKNLRGALYKAYLRGFVDAASAASEEATAALAGVRDAINNIPEGAATPIVNDLTTGGASMALSAEMGKVLKGELDTKVNPNLLDNWYFGNPVNQRGISTSANNAYGIDRWLTFGGTHTVGDGYVEISQNGIMSQYTQNASEFDGKHINLSVLTADGELFTGFNAATSTGSIYFFQAPDMVAYRTMAGIIQFYPKTKATKIIAAKLELGTQQTLAHQDANGNWVLNEIPDYNEQLLRCCMSKADSSDTYANNKQTAAAVNALPLDGSKAMTGALGVSGGYGRVTASSGGTAGVSVRSNPNDAANYTYIGVYSYEAIAKALKLYRYINGTPNEYTVLHTGNKPSGSYTGNGSATSRTVDTKGVGDALLIYNSYNVGIITKYSSFAIATQGTNAGTIKTFKNPDLYFANGVLYCATADTWVNGNGTVYNYQVL